MTWSINPSNLFILFLCMLIWNLNIETIVLERSLFLTPISEIERNISNKTKAFKLWFAVNFTERIKSMKTIKCLDSLFTLNSNKKRGK